MKFFIFIPILIFIANISTGQTTVISNNNSKKDTTIVPKKPLHYKIRYYSDKRFTAIHDTINYEKAGNKIIKPKPHYSSSRNIPVLKQDSLIVGYNVLDGRKKQIKISDKRKK